MPSLAPTLTPADRMSLQPQDAAGDSAESHFAFGPKQVLHALRRRWVVAIPLATAMAVLAYFGAENQLTPIYSARTMVHVGSEKPVLLYDNLGGRTDLASHQRTQVATIKSRLVRETVVRELAPFNLAMLKSKADPVAWLEKEITADYAVAPEILRVTMKGSDPDELLLVLNATRDVYLREVINKDRAERASRLDNLKELADKQATHLKTERKKLSNRAEALGARDVSALRVKYEQLIGRVNILHNELLQAHLERQRAEATPPGEPMAKEEPPAGPDPAAVEAAVSKAIAADPMVDAIQKEILRLERRIDDYERKLVSYQSDPDYKRASEDLAKNKSALARRRDSLRETVTGEMRMASRLMKPMPAAAPERSAVPGRQSVAFLESEIQKKEREAADLAKGIEELETLRGDLLRQDEQQNLLHSKIQALEIELQAPTRGRVIEDAIITEMPKLDRWFKNVAAPTVAAFLAVVVLVLLFDLRRGRVNGVEDLTAANIRVIGAVPSVHASLLPVFSASAHDRTHRDCLRLSDALDMTRAVIAPTLATARGYTLMVTSAVPGEGKTVVSAHLAARLAQSGLRTLLIDTDVRRPRIAQMLSLKRGPGFGEWVSGACSLSDVVTRGRLPGLDVIAAGGCDPRVVANVLDLQLPELLRSAKQNYDIIVLDTAPLLSAPETLALTRMCDGAMLSVMRDVSRISSVKTCVDRLASTHVAVLGAVVTGDSPSHPSGY